MEIESIIDTIFISVFLCIILFQEIEDIFFFDDIIFNDVYAFGGICRETIGKL